MVEHESEHSPPLLEHNASEVQPSPVDLAPYQQRLRMTFFDGFALLVSLQVGSGIFSSPSQVDGHTPSPGMALIVWTLSGLTAWAGAASFAELGAAIPINGGMQEYLKYVYSDYVAFLASWIWILAVKPSSMAILSIIFAQYWTNAIFPHSASIIFWLKLDWFSNREAVSDDASVDWNRISTWHILGQYTRALYTGIVSRLT
jgi:amino acid transporter